MKKKTQTIAFANRKGGVGKTTSTLEIGEALAKDGYNILLIDFDAQCNLSQAFEVEGYDTWDFMSYMREQIAIIQGQEINMPVTVFSLMCDPDIEVEEAIRHHKDNKNIDVMIGSEMLLGENITHDSEGNRVENPELLLREIIDDVKIKMDYDFILIDVGPTGGLIMENAIIASDYIVPVIKPGKDETKGYGSLMLDVIRCKRNFGTIETYNEKNEKVTEVCCKANLLGIILTMFDTSRKADIHTISEIIESEKIFGIEPFDTIIPNATLVVWSRINRRSAGEYQKHNIISASYELIKDEMIKRIEAETGNLMQTNLSRSVTPVDSIGGKEGLTMLKPTTLQTAELLDILPDEDVSIVKALIKRLVIARDPDCTKVTARERELLEKSDIEMEILFQNRTSGRNK